MNVSLDKYGENWDNIFGKKSGDETVTVKGIQLLNDNKLEAQLELIKKGHE